MTVLLLVGGLSLFSSGELKAQSQDTLSPITLEEAIQKAKSAYPKIQAARLEVENQEALKKTAWDLGNTKVFTGGEELSGNQGVYTIVGVQQQNIDVFGVAPKMRLQKERIALAGAALNLSELELKYQVKTSYGTLYAARKQYELYMELDSAFLEFERAAKIRYETEATSKLAYLAASNQSRQITIQKEQAFRDYRIALQRFNLWMVSDSLFTVSDEAITIWAKPLPIGKDSLNSHPLLDIANQEAEVAGQEVKTAKADFLPKLNLQYGTQEVGGQTGFYQYQAGISIPLFFMKNQGMVQSAKISQQIAEQNLYQTQLELQNNYQNALEAYYKWKTSWEYYETEALGLAKEQRKAAVTAYREGAIDYVTFLQNVKDAMQIEMTAWLSFEQYLNSRFQIEYYINQ